MIKSVIKKDKRLIYVQNSIFRSLNSKQKKIYHRIEKFLTLYSKFNKLNYKKIYFEYLKFIKIYIKDRKIFKTTKKYPYQIVKKTRITRLSYDLSLILSCLLTVHRFKIIEKINNLKNLKKTLFIGAGTGLEIYMAKKNLNNFSAYDPSSSKFIYEITGKQKFKKKNFDFFENNFDTIFLIEFLEHLRKPYDFLEKIYRSMKNNSKIICTTAKNIPQFDHLYNFISAKNFENKVKKIGFKIKFKEKIIHDLDMERINSDNIFYILQK